MLCVYRGGSVNAPAPGGGCRVKLVRGSQELETVDISCSWS